MLLALLDILNNYARYNASTADCAVEIKALLVGNNGECTEFTVSLLDCGRIKGKTQLDIVLKCLVNPEICVNIPQSQYKDGRPPATSF